MTNGMCVATLIGVALTIAACGEDSATVVANKQASQVTTIEKASASQETMLFCEGTTGHSLFGAANRKYTFNVKLTKVNGKVVKAATDQYTFTTEKVDVRSKDSIGPIYAQLIIEADSLILLRELPDSNKPRIDKTIIKDSGAFTLVNEPIVNASGQCQVRDKVF